MASEWFPHKERPLATAIGALAISIGSICAFIFSSMALESEDKLHPDIAKQYFYTYLFRQNLALTVLFGSGLFFINSPKREQLIKEEEKVEYDGLKIKIPEKFGMVEVLRKLVTNKNYVLLTLCFISLYSVYASIGAIVAQMTGPYGFTALDNSIFGATFLISGLVSSMVFGSILGKFKCYRLVFRIITIGSFIFLLNTFFTLPTRNNVLFALNMTFLGMTLIPIIPVSLDFSVILTEPVPEEMSAGWMILVSQVGAITMGLI
jgi:sugar phosphate permease